MFMVQHSESSEKRREENKLPSGSPCLTVAELVRDPLVFSVRKPWMCTRREADTRMVALVTFDIH